MDAFVDHLVRFWTDMVGRTDGPMSFRFFPILFIGMAMDVIYRLRALALYARPHHPHRLAKDGA